MSVHDSNQAQADFWTAAGPLWTKQRDRFDAQASDYGLAAIDALAPSAGERIVDIGCGAGTSTVQLAERVGDQGSVLGLDISPTMIEGATHLAEAGGITNVSYQVTDAMAEPFEPQADGVFSRFGVMFFSDATAGFANIRNALRPGGRLGFVCWQPPTENPWAAVPLQVAANYVELPVSADPGAPGPFSLSDPARIETVLSDAGYENINVSPVSVSSQLAPNMEEAIDFIAQLMPPVLALKESGDDRWTALRTDLEQAFSQWSDADGVAPPSAAWVVTARRPA